ncbi:MAG: hypothetical protein AABW59_05450 [archaeon]
MKRALGVMLAMLLILFGFVAGAHAQETPLQTYQYCFSDSLNSNRCFEFADEVALDQPVYDYTMDCLKRVESGDEIFCDRYSSPLYRQVIDLKDKCEIPYNYETDSTIAGSMVNCGESSCMYGPCYSKMDDAFEAVFAAADRANEDWLAAGSPKLSADGALQEEYNLVYGEYKKLWNEAMQTLDKASALCFNSGACTLACETSQERITCVPYKCLDEEKVFDDQQVCKTVSRWIADLSTRRFTIESQVDNLKKKIAEFEAQNQSTAVGGDIAALETELKGQQWGEGAPGGENGQIGGEAPEVKQRKETFFPNLFGRQPNKTPGIDVSTHGYPMATLFSSYPKIGLYLQENGKMFLVNTDTDGGSWFEGIGAIQGGWVSLPWIDIEPFEGIEKGTTISGEIQGLGSITESASIESYSDAQGNRWLKPEMYVKSDAPPGEYAAKIIINQTGANVAEVDFILEVEKHSAEKTGEVVFIAIVVLVIIILAVFVLGGIVFVAYWVIKNRASPEQKASKKAPKNAHK